jgi:hypothetical protein
MPKKSVVASGNLKGFQMKARTVLFSIAGGVLLTLVTGLFSNTPPMMVGATHYGYPFPWPTRLIIAPEYFPWRLDYLGLIGDILVWSIVVGVVLLVLAIARKSSR